VAHLYDHLHPAVLHLIARTIRVGAKARTPVAVCGEMAGEIDLTELLLGMGLRQFSMHPSQILSVKERLFTLSTKTAAKFAARVLRADDPLQIRKLIEKAVARPVSA
jgi:phosphotransferase system enzyme I (PtsI)